MDLNSRKNKILFFNNIITESLFKSITDDYLFTLLPIFVISIVRFSSGFERESIWLLPDISFASIVLLGSVISKFSKLKSVIQKDISHRFFMGLKIFIFLLIISVIILAITVFRENNPSISTSIIELLQIANIFFSLFLVFLINYYIELYTASSRPSMVHKNKIFYKYALLNLDIALGKIIYLNQISKKCIDANNLNNTFLVTNIEEEVEYQELNHKIETLDLQLNNLKQKLESGIDNTTP